MINKKDFLSIADLSPKEIWQVLGMAKKLKFDFKNNKVHGRLLSGKSIALIFEKQSLRTRISFEIGMANLGGHVVYLDPRDTGIGVRESEEDIAKVLSTMVNVLVVRTYNHETIEEIAKHASIPVINALSDIEHPCQALTDVYTIWEIKKKLKDLVIGYVGDGENNVAHSLCIAAAILGMTFRCGSPKGYFLNKNIIAQARQFSGKVLETEDPGEAVKNADVVVTDTWVSMGDADKEKRMKIFKEYQVNSQLMRLAKKDAIFMHCLPAYRGSEVSGEVIDGAQSVVFQEAGNRLYVQEALLLFLLGKSY